MDKLSHFNSSGEAHMVDIGTKPASHRSAVAGGSISMLPSTLSLILSGSHSKGDVLGIARIAGIMASKRTAELIPLCHPIPITHLEIEFSCETSLNRVSCYATASTFGSTGIEMEALMAVQISLLTVYDMCKAVDRGMTINEVQLYNKMGGKSGTWSR